MTMSAESATSDTVEPGEARIVTFAERADLGERASVTTSDAFPEYNNHGNTLNVYWSRLSDERPEFQFCLLNDTDEILARGESLPVHWDGSSTDLPAGLDGAIARGLDEEGANTLCAMAIAVPRHLRGRGISAAAVQAMRELGHRHGFAALIAPVRPNWKERYPLVPIEQYSGWRRPDGLLFDPWMRIHERLGGHVLRPEPRSVQITGTVAEWEAWTQMAFPQSGEYWFPGGLSTLAIDRDGDSGSYWEPNVWMHHTL
jgi:GNAT superfamily N-acetyltransferase